MTEEDPKLSRRYRELPQEEPPRRLDEAILAKARRAVAPRGRWYFPLAAAAVVVLAVAVTVQVQREQPAEEQVAIPGAQEPERALAKEERKRELRESARADAQYAAKPAPMRRERLSAATGIASSNFMHASPEQWLQGIADLRRQNRDDEAERQLAEFRKRYPGYRISKEMLERLEMPK